MVDEPGSSGRIGFLGTLTIVLTALKLAGFVAWSWWLITLPLWGIFALMASIFVLVEIDELLSKLFRINRFSPPLED